MTAEEPGDGGRSETDRAEEAVDGGRSETDRAEEAVDGGRSETDRTEEAVDGVSRRVERWTNAAARWVARAAARAREEAEDIWAEAQSVRHR
jgi:hypothetical protein